MKKELIILLCLLIIVGFVNANDNLTERSITGKSISGEVIGNITGKVSANINITVNVNTSPPTLTIISPENITYTTSLILLNWTSTLSNKIWYNLNNGANITITEPTILDLSNGGYILNLYANSTIGQTNKSVSFAVNVATGTTGGGGSGSSGGGSSGGGGTTGGDCIPVWGEWGEWGSCIGGEETRTRSDGCESTEIQIRTCGCTPDWQCGEWGECTNPEIEVSAQQSLEGGILTGTITKDIILGETEKFDFKESNETETGGDTGGSGTGGTTTGGSGNGGTTTGGSGGGGSSRVSSDPEVLSNETGRPTQTKNCIDLNSCGVTEDKPDEIQQCILGLEIEYLPQNTYITIANNTQINFWVKATKGSNEIIEINWFIDSTFIKKESNAGTVESFLDFTFDKDIRIIAQIIVGETTQNVEWQIRIDPHAIPNCKEEWFCEYTKCDSSGFKYASNCQDLNECRSNVDRPVKKTCNCIPNYDCAEFTECNVDYNLDEILKGNPSLKGSQERICNEITSCEDEEDIIHEFQECSLAVDVRVEKNEWCFEEYIEIYDIATEKLVSRVKEKSIQNIKRVDIGFLTTESKGICGYCFDHVKNYDEEEIDCGGEVCQVCVTRGLFFDYLYFIKILIWILLLMVSLYNIHKYNRGFGDLPKKISAEYKIHFKNSKTIK